MSSRDLHSQRRLAMHSNCFSHWLTRCFHSWRLQNLRFPFWSELQQKHHNGCNHLTESTMMALTTPPKICGAWQHLVVAVVVVVLVVIDVAPPQILFLLLISHSWTPFCPRRLLTLNYIVLMHIIVRIVLNYHRQEALECKARLFVCLCVVSTSTPLWCDVRGFGSYDKRREWGRKKKKGVI